MTSTALDPGVRRLVNPHTYHVSITDAVFDDKRRLLATLLLHAGPPVRSGTGLRYRRRDRRRSRRRPAAPRCRRFPFPHRAHPQGGMATRRLAAVLATALAGVGGQRRRRAAAAPAARIVAEWEPGLSADDVGGRITVDGYGVGGLGLYRLDDGVLAVCVQADIGHALDADYRPDAHAGGLRCPARVPAVAVRLGGGLRRRGRRAQRA